MDGLEILDKIKISCKLMPDKLHVFRVTKSSCELIPDWLDVFGETKTSCKLIPDGLEFLAKLKVHSRWIRNATASCWNSSTRQKIPDYIQKRPSNLRWKTTYSFWHCPTLYHTWNLNFITLAYHYTPKILKIIIFAKPIIHNWTLNEWNFWKCTWFSNDLFSIIVPRFDLSFLRMRSTWL